MVVAWQKEKFPAKQKRAAAVIIEKIMKEIEPPRENENNDSREQADEIGSDLETGNEVNAAIEKQGEDATAGIPRDTDAAKHQHKPDEPAGHN